MSEPIDRALPQYQDVGDTSYALKPADAWPALVNQADALSNPDDGLVAETIFAALPPGAAWRTPDGEAFDADSKMGGLLKAMAVPIAALYRRLFNIAMESTASTLIESLNEWEDEYGLPDPCLQENDTVADRLAALLFKVRSTGTITPRDFIDLAAMLGYEITIREPMPFAAGRSRCGSTKERVAGTINVTYYWIVKPGQTPVIPFRAGKARAGLTPLGDVTTLYELECVFRRVAPAWTMPVFDYS